MMNMFILLLMILSQLLRFFKKSKEQQKESSSPIRDWSFLLLGLVCEMESLPENDLRGTVLLFCQEEGILASLNCESLLIAQRVDLISGSRLGLRIVEVNVLSTRRIVRKLPEKRGCSRIVDQKLLEHLLVTLLFGRIRAELNFLSKEKPQADHPDIL